ncbi:amidase family protein [Thermodesulfobacteriota bacterium]
MEEWAKQSALTLTKAIKDRKISSSELLEYFIERYERLNQEINAIVATNLVQAREKAADADKALAKGEVFGSLHGLPMTLKDNLEIIGMPTTYGSPLFAKHMPEENADVVQSVLDAGAVVFGKTNLPLRAMDTQSFNDVYGQTNNPWDISRTPGGSSGGAAAALAAGLTGLEIGNDIGGSIRFPAHFCGIYGHKPSYNIVSRHGANKPWSQFKTRFPMDADMAVNGPLARSAEDLLLAMEIIVGPPAYQRKAIKITLPEPRKNAFSEFKVGVWIEDPLYPPDNDISAVLSDFIDRLTRTGVTLVNKKPDIDLKRSHYLRNAFEVATTILMQPAELYDKAVNALESNEENIKSWAKAMTMKHRDWKLLDMERSFLRQKWDDYFNDVDIMLCPVTRIPAHPHDHTPMRNRVVKFNEETLKYWDVMGPWNSLSLVAYLPATVVPAGFTPGGLPVGIQIVGPYLEDLTPIQFAINLEKEIIGPYQLPPGFDQ